MSSTDDRILGGEELLTLGRELLAEGREIRMRLGGHSMFPLLLPGDIATITPVKEDELHIGDVVVCDRGDRWVAHRILGFIDDNNVKGLISMGDCTSSRDLPVLLSDLIGKVAAVHRKGKKNEMGSLFYQSAGKLMVHGAPLIQMPLHVIFRGLYLIYRVAIRAGVPIRKAL